MKFSKEFLVELTYCNVDDEFDGARVVEKRIASTGRWSIHYVQVFEFEGVFYRTNYSRGATESQDESPYEYAPAEIECSEVRPIEKTVTVYE